MKTRSASLFGKVLPKAVAVACCFLALVSAAAAEEVRISAAASLRDAVNELCDSYCRTHRGVRFVKNFGGSGQLAKQIQSGAPADIFLPANREWLDYLKGRKMLDPSSIGTFTFNTLVFAGAPGKASCLKDLVDLQRIAIGSPLSVPAGEYALAALKKAGLDRQLEKKLVMAKDVRESLMYVERGEVDGGFVYRTDALRAKRARILFTVPQELYPRVVYPIALTVPGGKNGAAVGFYAYLRGLDAKSVLAKYGFAGS